MAPTRPRGRSHARRGTRKKAKTWRGRHFLGTRDLSPAEILTVLDLAAKLKRTTPAKLGTPLRGRHVFNFFAEPSTRTKASFSLAARRLGCESVDFSPIASSFQKGESLIDTAKTIESMGIDFVVVRHAASGAPHFLASRIRAHVINAGDGANEHPTQALLDLFTMREALGKVSGLKVILVGDVAHSRVARSNIWALRKLNNRVIVVGPPTLASRDMASLGVKVTHDLDAAIRGADVVMMLRLQLERQGRFLFPSVSEYTRYFGLTPERFARLRDGTIVMHPGPMNRGLEICSEAADSNRSVILDQVHNGVWIRMALLLLLGGVRP